MNGTGTCARARARGGVGEEGEGRERGRNLARETRESTQTTTAADCEILERARQSRALKVLDGDLDQVLPRSFLRSLVTRPPSSPEDRRFRDSALSQFSFSFFSQFAGTGGGRKKRSDAWFSIARLLIFRVQIRVKIDGRDRRTDPLICFSRFKRDFVEFALHYQPDIYISYISWN